MVDQYARLRALRALAAPGSGATEPERELAKEKADELEAKLYGNGNSSSTNDTTTTSRDGSPPFGSAAWAEWSDIVNAQRRAQAERIAEDLLRNQWRWNREYYDEYGRPWPKDTPKEDEDYGYEVFNERSEYYDDE